MVRSAGRRGRFRNQNAGRQAAIQNPGRYMRSATRNGRGPQNYMNLAGGVKRPEILREV